MNSSEYWKNLSEKITDPGQTKNKRPDTSDLEINFMKEYLSEDDEVVDLGAGTGLITNKIEPLVKSVVAVEKFEKFTNYINKSDKILVINADLLGFKIHKEFDKLLLTGVAQCFNKEDATGIYQRSFDMLKAGGIMIARTHCGLEEDVTIDGFSQELGTKYFAQYRKLDDEIDTIKSCGFEEVTTHDIFPDSLNVWDNTRHFMFICKKPG